MVPETSRGAPSPGRMEAGWRSLARVHDLVKDRLESRLRAAHEISLSEFRVLRRLAEEEDCRLRMAQLADQVGLTPSAASRLVARLEEGRGLLDRCLCDHDRRGVYTRLTEEGEELLEEAEEAYAEALRAAWTEAAETGDLAAVTEAMDADGD